MSAKEKNLAELRKIVKKSQGPRQVIAITNGGDGPIVKKRLEALRQDVFRADGETTIIAHEEVTRRGQLLGLLDAVEGAKDLKREGVSLGIMMPGKGTRLSPLTQRLAGIKPLMPMLIRQSEKSPWLGGATASLYSWTHVAYHLERLGFSGIAWKWGDEPQIPGLELAKLQGDFSEVDAIRFGSIATINDDLAENKEWLFCKDDDGKLTLQVRRRTRAKLCQRFGYQADDKKACALVHIGSPALSWLFLKEAQAVFGDVKGWLDVDGYLFEALTHSEEEWQAEFERDAGLRDLLISCPDFYQRAQMLKAKIEIKRNKPLDIRVIDFGDDLYWGDIGQLEKARQSFALAAQEGSTGEFARRLAIIDEEKRDAFNNRIVGQCDYPKDGSVKNSLLVDSTIKKGNVDGATIVESQIGHANIAQGCVIVQSTLVKATFAEKVFSFRSIAEKLELQPTYVHTSIIVDPIELKIESIRWPMDQDPGKGDAYQLPQANNKYSFAELFEMSRQREISPDAIEERIDAEIRKPLRSKIDHV